MEAIIFIAAVVIGLFQIMLFIKIWEMTNNVQRLTDHFLNQAKAAAPKLSEEAAQASPTQKDVNNKPEAKAQDSPSKTEDSQLDNVKPGDKIRHLKSGNVYTVYSISDNKFCCDTGWLSGYKFFKKEEVEFVSAQE